GAQRGGHDLDVKLGDGGHGGEGQEQDQGGAGDQAADPAEALDDGRLGGAGGVVLLAHAGQQEDLVVHGQAVEEGEGHQRHPHGDGAGGRDAPDRLPAVALLPDQHQHPVGGADRKQVERDRLGGQQQRPEGPGQQHEGDHGGGGQQQREAAVEAGGGVDGQGTAAPDPGPGQLGGGKVADPGQGRLT